VLNLNSNLGSPEEQEENIEVSESQHSARGRGRPKGSGRRTPPGSLPDEELVAVYKAAAERYGKDSEEAALAFEPIYARYWPQTYGLALGKLGALYADDLAQETMQTVWERLNGREIITNLRGLVRHSFEREYVTILEKLLQGRRLQRARQAEAGLASGTNPESGKIKGAVVVSLNATAPGADGESFELINLMEDPHADVVDAASRLEQIRVLHSLMEKMPAQYRAPLVCQWLLGMKIRTVAEELSMTIDQVKHNTGRGIAWLRKNMPGQPEDWLI